MLFFAAQRESVQGLGSCRASGECRFERSKHVPATCLPLESTGLLQLGRLSRGKSLRTRERGQQSLTHGAFGVARVIFVLFFILFIPVSCNACSSSVHLCTSKLLAVCDILYPRMC